MIRTQVSFDETTYRAARQEAKRRGISFAELCRRAIARTLADRRLDPTGTPSARPWMRFAGSLRSDDAGASRTVNEVVHGRRRP